MFPSAELGIVPFIASLRHNSFNISVLRVKVTRRVGGFVREEDVAPPLQLRRLCISGSYAAMISLGLALARSCNNESDSRGNYAPDDFRRFNNM